ncbi:unnamed protein product [Prunus armeniaca]
MPSRDSSKASSSQVPLYLWGGSEVYKKRFVANLRRVTNEDQFQRWHAAYASAIPEDVHIKLEKPLTDNMPCVDANDPNARIITFRPFYFSLGFKFLLSKLFKEVFCAMGCAPSQCTPNVYRAIMCFENLSRFFTLELTVREFFYFFEVRCFKEYAQLRTCNVKLFDSLSQGDHVWHDDVLEVSGRWEGDVGDGPLVPIIYCNSNDISKKLELEPDMAKVRRALNIPQKFREWRWLLSEYREEDGGLPPAEDAEVKSPRTQATSPRARNVSPLRKKPKLHSVEKIQVGVVPASSVRVKHLVGADNKKIGGMRNIRGAPLKPLADELGDHDLLREVSKSGGRCGRSTHSSNRHDPTVESRAVKCGVDSTLQIPLEVRLAEARKARESSARTKGPSATSAVDPKVDKSSPAGDAGVSSLLKTQFLSSPSSCAELVDQIRQAGDLGAFSSLSLEKQREATLHLLQKGVVFAAETIRNSSAVAPSSAKLSKLEKKNAELVSKLSAEQTRYEQKTSDLRAMISELKSSLAEKDSELNSSAADLASRKDAYFHLERKNADISHSYDKLLARFHAYHESTEESKSEVAMDAYKLGCLDCTKGYDPFYAIGDGEIEMLYPDLPPAKSEEANAVNTEGADEQVAKEAVTEEDGAEEDAADEVVADVIDQACGAAESVADQADAEEAVDQGSPAGVSE